MKSTTPGKQPALITISEITPNKWTALTRQNLEQLIQIYDLNAYLFTRIIQIEAKSKPHSHPVLTLNTRFAEQPNKLLSAFIHEQLHWWSTQKKHHMVKAVKDLKKLFPTLPKDSTYLHLIICYLEYEAMVHYVEQKEANKVLGDFVQKDKVYPWINTQVYMKYRAIGNIISKYKLSPLESNKKARTL
ncbi:MAG: hypothetical protein H0V66_13290 [Bdellovibrionales bacterium]|nr:hypothetical protein [Bdellovibrionales bacterium]